MAKGKIEINAEACKSCRYCVQTCPGKVLSVGEKVNSFGYLYVVCADPEACTGCALCAQICPDAAIEVWRE